MDVPALGIVFLIYLGHMNAQSMDTALLSNIEMLEQEFEMISDERKEDLKFLAQEIKRQLRLSGQSKVVFVCTHNSRRSQLAEIWLRAALAHYNLAGVQSYSGGTESTAFNVRMVDALRRYGFFLEVTENSKNPVYLAKLNATDEGSKMFSKKFNDAYNPALGFIAVMVCSEADKECPFVPGADARISLPYQDPKISDDTAEEHYTYDAKVKEIGREILYAVKSVRAESNP